MEPNEQSFDQAVEELKAQKEDEETSAEAGEVPAKESAT
jgi:hypothetical protein